MINQLVLFMLLERDISMWSEEQNLLYAFMYSLPLENSLTFNNTIVSYNNGSLLRPLSR